MVWTNTLMDIPGTNPIHAIFTMNSITVFVLLVVWVIYISIIPTTNTLLEKDVMGL